jgi:hypothetical protein
MRRVRMTIAAPGKRIDARFKRIERRSDARFDAVDARFAAVEIARSNRSARSRIGLRRCLKTSSGHGRKRWNEHENRLKDLERTRGSKVSSLPAGSI